MRDWPVAGQNHISMPPAKRAWAIPAPGAGSHPRATERPEAARSDPHATRTLPARRSSRPRPMRGGEGDHKGGGIDLNRFLEFSLRGPAMLGLAKRAGDTLACPSQGLAPPSWTVVEASFGKTGFPPARE